MLVALFLVGFVVITSFWAALSFIADKVTGKGESGDGTVLMLLGTGCSAAMWIMLWLHLGVL